MDVELTRVLPSLRDVEGVLASFVVSDEGDVVARDLAAFVDDSTLQEVAPRLGRFHEALSSSGDFLDFFVLEFAQQSLHTRRVPNGFLCLLTSPQVNAPSLRMAVNLMARKVGDRIAQQRQMQEALAPTPAPILLQTPAARPTPPPLPNVTVGGRATPQTMVTRPTPSSGLAAAARASATRTAVVAPPPIPANTPPARPLRVYRGTVQKR
jgi:predicted regulator of Ras-like GTPase activity (Roadblock/LC7/MglB family)